MAVKKIYVGERDGPLWDAAQRVADRRRISVSQLVRDALADYMPRAATAPDPADRWASIAPDTA